MPIPNTTSDTIAKLLKKRMLCYLGMSKLVHTDQGAQFESRLLCILDHHCPGWLRSNAFCCLRFSFLFCHLYKCLLVSIAAEAAEFCGVCLANAGWVSVLACCWKVVRHAPLSLLILLSIRYSSTVSFLSGCRMVFNGFCRTF